MKPILNVQNMNISYETNHGWFQAVKNISFTVFENEVFGIVGESGSGKSTLCMGILKLLPTTAKCEQSNIQFAGKEISNISDEELRKLRWEEISYIPQSAMATLNPVKRIRSHFYETILDHEGKRPKKELEERTVAALDRVSLDPSVANQYPHELSGGMKQRVCVALSIVLSPKLIFADEPTSALDVICQRMVLEILSDIQKQEKASMIMVGHDMALQAQIANRMGIMYAGHFVEIGTVKDIFHNPAHPYTKSLIRSIPSIQRKENISILAKAELSESERKLFKTPRPLCEIEPGHFVADFDERR